MRAAFRNRQRQRVFVHHPEHRTARGRRGHAWARLSTCALRLAVLLLVVFAIGGYGLPVVHAQAAADAKVQLQTPAETIRRRAAAFLRGRLSLAASASPAQTLALARAQHLALSAAPQTAPLNTPWTAVGPLQVQTSAYGLVTGRITSVAIDPNDTSGNTVYIGTSGGGVWKSTNAAGPASAVSFHPLTDTLPVFSPNGGSAIPSLSIGAVSVQPGGTGVVLAGTGDPNDATDSYYGEGLLRSTDGGITWTLVQQTTSGHGFYGEAFAGFAWSTASPQTVVAALTASAEAAIVRNNTAYGYLGLFYSQDGGANWLPATVQDGSTVVQDRNNDITNFRGNAATSVVWNPVRQRFYAAVRSHGYYESADGITFTRMANQPGAGLTVAACPTRSGTYGSASCPIFRGALAAQPVSGDLFALTVDANNNDQGLWQDTCNLSGSACASSTVKWSTHIDATPMETGGKIAQGDYNLSLAAVPAATALSMTDTLLFAGTEDLFRCGLSGGCSLRNTTNTQNGCASAAGVAPSQHAIAWQTNLSNSSAPRIVLGNDGGLWRSLDGVRQQGAVCSADDKTHFDNLNGALGSLAMVSGFSSHPSDANVLLAALGANGSAASTTAAQASDQAAWTQLSSGESGTVAIDQSNGQTWLVQSGAGVALHTCTNGTACTAADFAGPAAIGSAQVQRDGSLTDAPALLDPGLNTNVIAGTCRVFRGPAGGGSTWSTSSAISRFLAGPTAPACTSSDGYIRSLAAGGPAVNTNGSQTSGSTVLYAGLAGGADGGSSYGGQIYVNTAANVATSSTAWTNIAANSVTNDYAAFNAGGFDISGIAVDPSDATGRTVYATVMGFGYPHLYRSTNAGATWTNISSNLPNAPANSVAVDPNNPLIVYVALDTGVYVATDVTSCVNPATGTTGNCWGALGTSLPNAPVLSLVASKGVSGGVLRAGTFGRGIWQVPLLSAGQALAPVASFSPASLTFSTQAVGSTSTAQTVTLTNTGNTAFAITSLTASAGFGETDTCANTSLTVNASCTISVTFSPSAAGAANGSVLVYGNVSGGYATLPLSGTAQGVPNLVLSPTSLAFPVTPIGATSASQTVTVSNSGTGAAGLTSPVGSPDFPVASTTCGSTLAPGGACTVAVAFAPAQNGPEIGTLSFGDGVANYAAQLHGNGTGSPNVTVSPASISFGNFPVSGTLGTERVYLTNGGNASAQLGPPSTTGDFGIFQNDCPALLAAGQTCSMIVSYAPSTPGPHTGTFNITDAGVTTHTIPLSGDAFATTVSFAPAALTFSTTEVGSTSAGQTVTMTNTGGNGLTLGVLAAAGDFGILSNTCVGTLPPQGSCTFSINFSPASDGPRYGSISLPDQYTTHDILLSGNGHGTPSVAVTPSALAFGTIAINRTSTPQTVTVTNSGTAAIALSPAAITGDFFLAATSCGTSLAARSNCTLTVNFTPAAEGMRTGTLTVTDAIGAHAVALSGNGIGQAIVTLTPGALTFTSAAVGATSAPLTVSVNNGGTVAAVLSTPTITGDFAVTGSTCGGTLAPLASCSLSVVFKPTASGVRSGVLAVSDAQGSHTTALSGNGITGALTATPAALQFADTALGGTTAQKAVVVTNTGNAALTINSAVVAGDYAVTGNCSGTTLAAGTSCTVAVTFSPTAIGARSGTLTFAFTGASSATAVVTLSGNGTGAFSVVLTPTSEDFGTQLTGTTSAVRNITVSNTGTTSGTLGNISVTGDFQLTANTCGTSLPAQTGCTVSVVFMPTMAGARTGVLTVMSGAGTQTATLTGIGTAAATDTLSPLALTFGSTTVNTTSATQTVTLTNSGDTALTLVSAQILAGDFTAVNGCGPTLPAHSTCGITVAFAPKSVGTLTGTLQVIDVQHSQAVTLSGTAVAGAGVSLLPASLTFASTGVGVAGAAQSLTLTNNGGSPLTLAAVTVIGDFGILSGGGTCAVNATVPAGGSCTLSIAFLPSGAGVRTGSVVITGNAPAQTAQLTGTGIDFQFVASGDTSVIIANGGNATFPLLIRPLGTPTSDPVTYTCTGAPANASCKITSQYSDLSAVGTVSLTVLTGTTTAKRIPLTAAFLLPMVLGPVWMLRRRRLPSVLAALLALCVCFGVSGCGSGRRLADAGSGSSSGGGSTGPVTPSGTYAIVAGATAAGVTHTVSLTLVVK